MERAMQPEDPIMTVAEAAEYLSVKSDWLYDNYRALKAPAIKLGRQIRFRRSDLDKWITTLKVAA